MIDTKKAGNKLSAETGTHVDIEVGKDKIRLKCLLVGIEPGKYLILGSLNKIHINGLENALVKNASVIARYIHSGHIYGFETEVLNYISKPVWLAFFKYPENIEEHNFRKFERVDCHLPAKISIGYTFLNGSIIDLSKGGCLYTLKADKVISMKMLNEMSSVNLKLHLPGMEEELILKGSAKSINKKDDIIRIGIQFDNFETETKDMLYSFIETALN